VDALLGPDVVDGGVDVLGDDVAAVEEAAGHVLAGPRVALHHLVGRLEALGRDVGDGHRPVQCGLRRRHGRVRRQREVDPGVRHQVGLELRQVHVDGSLEAQRRRDRRHDLKIIIIDLYSKH